MGTRAQLDSPRLYEVRCAEGGSVRLFCIHKCAIVITNWLLMLTVSWIGTKWTNMIITFLDVGHIHLPLCPSFSLDHTVLPQAQIGEQNSFTPENLI